MLRGVLFEEVVLALVLKPIHYPHQAQQDGVIINALFMTILELCHLKKEDYYDDDETTR